MGKENGHVQAYSPNGPTHFGEKPVHDENRHRVKLRYAHKILRPTASKLIKGCRAGLCGGTPHLLMTFQTALGQMQGCADFICIRNHPT